MNDSNIDASDSQSSPKRSLHGQLLSLASVSPSEDVTLKLIEFSSQHRNLILHSDQWPGYALKHAYSTADIPSLIRERDFLRTIRDAPMSSSMLIWPEVQWLEEAGALVQPVQGLARSLHQTMKSGTSGVDVSAFETLAGLLVELHRVPAHDAELPSVNPIMFQHLGLSYQSFVSSTDNERQFAVLLQQLPELETSQRETFGTWRDESIVHAELTWTNVLVHDSGLLQLIDWEMAGTGDPCWDIGTVLSEFVAFWALSIPVVGGEPYEALAKHPIEDMQPAIQAFWNGYAGTKEFDPATARKKLLKSVRFAGARLIQTAYERTQTMTHLTPHIYLLLQLSLNIMEQPEEAAAELFGLTVPSVSR